MKYLLWTFMIYFEGNEKVKQAAVTPKSVFWRGLGLRRQFSTSLGAGVATMNDLTFCSIEKHECSSMRRTTTENTNSFQ